MFFLVSPVGGDPLVVTRGDPLAQTQIVQAGAVAGVAAPLLRAKPAEAKGINKTKFPGKAPIITVFDHRGCKRGGPNKEYTGSKTGDQVPYPLLSEALARQILTAALGLGFRVR
jgi:hypothetical protein